MKKCDGKMLVVDDEEMIRRLCARTLQGMGLIVESASSGQQAWSRLNQREFDCVLTDISMPGPMDGTVLTEEVKNRFPATDILIMTGNPNLITAVSTLKHGALDYLTKPFAPMVLESAVARCFERRRLSGELNKERMLRRELEAAYAELQKVERAKNSFISILNHELRTPLTIAISAAQMLERVSDPEQTHKIMDMLRSSLTRENEVIEELMLYSRVAPGDLVVERREIHLEEALRALVENYRSVWEPKQLSVEIVAGDAGEPFWGDSALLQDAFKHLLLNAVHFNTKGGRVCIEVRHRSGRLEVLFSDTGIGIAPELQAQIFDRFYQVAEHMTRSIGGLGLGLAIVRRIVEAHGGFITVSGRPGGGSEFMVSLPRGVPPLPKLLVEAAS